ncbi:MAG: GntR family transcriptional regulator [Victivallales bacterium]|nr:GntR family transcriptional regulator [Victivallales bacterium]
MLEKKHQEVFARLVGALSDRSLAVGDRVLPERDFARAWSVNMSTIRRAYRTLVLGGIVEKRIGSGTYLFQKPGAPWLERSINLVMPPSRGLAGDMEIEMVFRELAAQTGRKYRVIHPMPEDYGELLFSCQYFGLPTILGIDCEPKCLQPHPEFFVKLSEVAYQRGIPSVLCDDRAVMGMLVEHLREQGCRRIALLGTRSTRILQDYQRSFWQDALGDDYSEELFILSDVSEVRALSECAYEAVTQALRTMRFDGLIALVDDLAFGALAAIRNCGLRVPQDIGVASIGNTALARLANPSLTSVNPDMVGHFRAAIEMLDENHLHPDKLELVKFVSSELVVRESTTGRVTAP